MNVEVHRKDEFPLTVNTIVDAFSMASSDLTIEEITWDEHSSNSRIHFIRRGISWEFDSELINHPNQGVLDV